MDARSMQLVEMLTELSASVNGMLSALHAAVGMVRPSAMAAALTGIARATENAALKVLDEAEGLQDDQGKLNTALERLRAHLPAGDTAAVAIWEEAFGCSNAFSKRAMKFIAAMEFQDLACQHLGHSVQAIDQVSEQLSSILALFDIWPQDTSNIMTDGLKLLGGADQALGERQAIADQLFAEHAR
jgi:chemotaxis regulatin CheY-phosphate phosphatase CheZ